MCVPTNMLCKLSCLCTDPYIVKLFCPYSVCIFALLNLNFMTCPSPHHSYWILSFWLAFRPIIFPNVPSISPFTEHRHISQLHVWGGGGSGIPNTYASSAFYISTFFPALNLKIPAVHSYCLLIICLADSLSV